MTRVGDTSVLYALFDASDKWHSFARKEVSKGGVVYVPPEILLETIQLLETRGGWESASKALSYMMGSPWFRLPPRPHLEAVAHHYHQARGRLSLADAVVVETARALALPALTKDRAIVESLEAT